MTNTEGLQFYYQEIQCALSHEISLGVLMSHMMNQIHLELVRVTNGVDACPFGISFPKYSKEPSVVRVDPGEVQEEGFHARYCPIGDRIRLYACRFEDFERLDIRRSVSRLVDYVEIGEIRELKRRNHGWAIYKRFQPKGSTDRMIRRRMKRHGVGLDEAMSHFAQCEMERCHLPYLDMKSHSSDQRFRLFIDKVVMETNTHSGRQDWTFSTYGLSSKVAVPDF